MLEAVLKRLNELLEEKDMSLYALSYNSAVPYSTVKNIFKGGSKNPGVVTLKLLCDGLGITITEFFNSPIFTELEIEDIE